MSAQAWSWSSFSRLGRPLLALHQRHCALHSGQVLPACLPPPLPLPATSGLVLLALPPQPVPAASPCLCPCPCSCHLLDSSSNSCVLNRIELNDIPHCDDSGRRRSSYDVIIRRTTVIQCRRLSYDHVRQPWAYGSVFLRHRTM